MADESQSRPASLRDVVRDASKLASKRKELDALRYDQLREWAQNREFYAGNQWVFWSKVAHRVETLAVDEGDKPRYKVRLTENHITPGVNSLVAQMTKTRPVIYAVPNTGSDVDVKSAELAESLYEHWWREFGLKGKLQTALVNAQISAGYWLITYDPYAGKPAKFMLNPETGQPILDEQLAQIFREEIQEQAQQAGMDPAQILAQYEKTVYMGDIRVQVLSGEDVWLDPVASNFEDCVYAICKYPVDIDEIKSRWKKDVTPDSSPGRMAPVLLQSNAKDERPKTARDVYCMYVKPHAAMPKGRYVCWIEGPNEILYQGDWEFPTNDLPIVAFPGIENPDSAVDMPRVTMARPIQKAVNNGVSKIEMHKNLTMKAQMIAPVGSLRQRLTDEPGAVFEFSPVAGMQPEWRQTPALPQYVFASLADHRVQLDRIFNIMPTERNSLPARTDSGQLVDLIQEAVADQISPEIQRMEDALARAGMLMAGLAQKFYIEPRYLKITGPGGSSASKKFMGADLAGGFSFHAQAGSGLPRTRAGQVQQIKELMEMQLISPIEALPMLPIAGLKTVQMRLKADEEKALREHEKLLKGEPINPGAMQEAIQAVQMGVNPQTGEPLQSPEEAQQVVMMAGLQPMPYENMQAELAIHASHMKTPEFEAYPPEVQQAFVMHFMATREQLMNAPSLTDPAKVSLSLKGTVGPTVAAEMLQQKGIRGATPESMAEPPLETSVYDSLDKADADDAGNDPLTEMEQILTMSQARDAHDLKQAKAVHQLHAARHQMARDSQQHSDNERRAEEMHRERIRQMRKPRPASGR